MEFMVRNGEKIKTIAARTKVPVSEILSANKIRSRNTLTYPGQRLIMPVQIQIRVWDPTREDMTGYSPSREDRGEADDYELLIDSSNYSLVEDFIDLTAAHYDSIEYANIGQHIKRIDKSITYLLHKIDSVKQADFKFDYDDYDKNSVLNKMKMARDKYYAEGPIGKKIDSLKEEKVWLGQRLIVLRNQIAEYEYLSDNAVYASTHFKHEEQSKPTNWGDHLKYEIAYLKGKNEAAQPKPANTENQPKPPVVVPKDTHITQPPVIPVAVNNSKTETAQTKPLVTPPVDNTAVKDPPKAPEIKAPHLESFKPSTTIAPVAAISKDDVNLMDTVFVESVLPHYKSDFAILSKQKYTTEIKTNLALHSLALLSKEQAAIKLPAEPPVVKQPVIKETQKTAEKENIKPTLPAANTNITQPVAPIPPVKQKAIDTAVTIVPPKPQVIVSEPVAPPKQEAVSIDLNRAPASTLASAYKPAATIQTDIDTVREKKVKEVSTDPLASYKTDSIIDNTIRIKEIPVAEYKNKPKYLIPVDSTNRIKGEFYLIRARQALEKGDFKNGDKFLRKSLDLDPNNAQAWMLHADLFLTMGQADQSLKEYIISGEIDSTNPKIFYNIALLYVRANNHQKAYKYFSRAIEVNEKYLMAYIGRASLLVDDRDYQGAVQDYDRLLSINKYYSPAFKARGLAKMEMGKFADAVNDFNQYLEIEDPDAYVIYQRGISKIYANTLLQGCLDLATAHDMGFKEADRAIKKFCE